MLDYLCGMLDYLVTIGWLTFCYFSWKYTPMNLGYRGPTEEERKTMCMICDYEETGEVPEGYTRGVVRITHVHTHQSIVVECFMEKREGETALVFRVLPEEEDQKAWIPDFDSFVADVE